MRVFLALCLLLSITVVTVSSCYYDNEEFLYGSAQPCTDTLTSVSYTRTLVPIFQSNCYGCHSGSRPDGNISMGTYAADKALAVNGKLYGTIQHASGYKAMPQNKPKLSSCEIGWVKKWIDAGEPNN